MTNRQGNSAIQRTSLLLDFYVGFYDETNVQKDNMNSKKSEIHKNKYTARKYTACRDEGCRVGDGH